MAGWVGGWLVGWLAGLARLVGPGWAGWLVGWLHAHTQRELTCTHVKNCFHKGAG